MSGWQVKPWEESLDVCSGRVEHTDKKEGNGHLVNVYKVLGMMSCLFPISIYPPIILYRVK